MKKESESFQRGGQNVGKRDSIVRVPAGSPILRTAEDMERLKRLAAMPDDEIDFSDIPRLTQEEYETALRQIQERRQHLKKAS